MRETPVASLLGVLANLVERAPEQPVFWPVRRKNIVTNLKEMLPSRWLPHLPHNVDLAAQKPLLLFDAYIVKPQTALDEMIK